MNNQLLIFLKEMGYKAQLALYRGTSFLSNISKVDYPSKAGGSNVQGVGTFFWHLSSLGQILPYNFKTLYAHFTQKIWIKNFILFINNMETCGISFQDLCEILLKWVYTNGGNINLNNFSFGATHRYSTLNLSAWSAAAVNLQVLRIRTSMCVHTH